MWSGDRPGRCSYRETGGRSLNTGEIIAQDGSLVEVAGTDDAVKDVRRMAIGLEQVVRYLLST